MASSRDLSVKLLESDVKAKAHGSQRPAPDPERVFIISSQQPLSPETSTKWHALVRVFFCLLTFSLGLLAWGCFNFSWADSWTGLGHGSLVVPLSDDPAGALGDRYLLGVGKADITGPVVELNLMGYADTNQIGTGLRQRLYSRAFIVGDVSRPADRFVYLVLDTLAGDTAIRYGILSALRAMGPDYQQLYGQHNVAVTGTHSHAGPGGWLNYLLPQITSMGFDHQGYRAIVEGATLSIRRAHESLQPGFLSVGTTRVRGANINRSMFAYLANPEAERARYNATAADDHDDGSVDKDLTLLKLRRASDGKNIGVLTWFPTHGTSLLGNNTLVAGDNKGVAAYLFEKSMRDDGVAANAAEGFVAGFSQANVGDTSPNVLGAWCDDGSGQMCSLENSTCPVTGKAQACHGRGPMFRQGDTGTASCFEVGKRQFEPARALYDGLLERDASSSNFPAAAAAAGQAIRGSWVKSFHWFHNMSGFEFVLPNGSTARTCPAALGYGFAGGTSDWPGHFDFTQHDGNETTTSPVWRAVSHLIKAPSAEQRACHGAKAILLDVGEVSSPYEWTPNVSDVQMFRVGQLLIIVSPGEATTMAGRRWKEAVGDVSADMFQREYDGDTARRMSPVVVLGGPANSYTHYIATEEEYAIQRYEGASTLYGPHTLAAYINVTLSLLPSLAQSGGGGAGGGLAHLPPHLGPSVFPPDNSNRSLSFVPGVFRDGAGLFRHFGDVVEDVEKLVYDRDGTAQPEEPLRIRATFVGANPRNNLRLEGTFAAVERLAVASSSGPVTEAGGDGGNGDGGDGGDDGATWQTVRDDGDWSLVYRWRRTSGLLGTSEVDIEWEVEDWAEAGTYRLRYYGDAKSLGGKIEGFEGASRAFTLV